MSFIAPMIDWIARQTAGLSAHERIALSARLAHDKPAAPASPFEGFGLPLRTYVGDVVEDGPDYETSGARIVVDWKQDGLILGFDKGAHAAGAAHSHHAGRRDTGPSNRSDDFPQLLIERRVDGFDLIVSPKPGADAVLRLRLLDSGDVFTEAL